MKFHIEANYLIDDYRSLIVFTEDGYWEGYIGINSSDTMYQCSQHEITQLADFKVMGFNSVYPIKNDDLWWICFYSRDLGRSPNFRLANKYFKVQQKRGLSHLFKGYKYKKLRSMEWEEVLGKLLEATKELKILNNKEVIK